MKKLIVVALLLCSVASFAHRRPNVRPGDPGLRREAPPADMVRPHPDRLPPPGAEHYRSPFALNFFSLSFPWCEPLEIHGLRLNLTMPFASAGHDVVCGFDLGLAGEARYDVRGVAVNLFDNWSETFAGIGISIVNAVNELHGLHIGLVNVAQGGRGIQIGLWNQSEFMSCPIIGVVR